jgi:hypothetical protein
MGICVYVWSLGSSFPSTRPRSLELTVQIVALSPGFMGESCLKRFNGAICTRTELRRLCYSLLVPSLHMTTPKFQALSNLHRSTMRYLRRPILDLGVRFARSHEVLVRVSMYFGC